MPVKRLTTAQHHEIRQQYRAGAKCKDLAQLYHVTQPAISYICKDIYQEQLWKDMTEQVNWDVVSELAPENVADEIKEWLTNVPDFVKNMYTPSTWSVYVLRHPLLGGLRSSQIARILDLPVTTVYSRLCYIREKHPEHWRHNHVTPPKQGWRRNDFLHNNPRRPLYDLFETADGVLQVETTNEADQTTTQTPWETY